ncbi:general odorant-binding protein 45-like [Toxorhynchites rutilus septentrionalis]|uniref:general odorant-binding protein 45-like n=1 Tax=Toxorhynchites rutilus septentrionalis TaxID=329112 RepID=UPI0024798018|nr:general odorant-binding protein 45-like [Toxorhynchites rutilus septentrionalis]
MKLLVAILVVAVASTASANIYRVELQESHFAYQLKSFRQALDECAETLEIPLEAVDRLVAFNFITHERDLKCLIRCAGINLGWWSDITGVRAPVLESYFQPACGDVGYRRRTHECIDAKLVICQDDCSKAYESFLCFFHQYGNLKCSEEYIPLSQLEAVQAAIDCINVLQIPRELLEQYISGVIPDVPATHCLFRCQYLAEGLYDSQYGLNLTRFYIRHHDYPSLDFLTENMKACTELALRENCDECARVFQAKKCFAGCSEPAHTIEILRQASAILLGCDAPLISPVIKLAGPKPLLAPPLPPLAPPPPPPFLAGPQPFHGPAPIAPALPIGPPPAVLPSPAALLPPIPPPPAAALTQSYYQTYQAPPRPICRHCNNAVPKCKYCKK